MDDLISRQAAIDDLQGKDPSQIWDTADIEVWVNALPPADAVEVVRCWNCVWWDNCPSSTITPNFHKCKRVGRMSMPSDGFCSYGERKDG